MRRWFFSLGLAGFLMLGLNLRAGAAEDFFLRGFEDSSLGAYVVFSYNAPTITIDIRNTSLTEAHPDARLTAFAFNIPDNVSVDTVTVSDINCSTDGAGWFSVSARNSIDTPGLFGFFDIAAITGPNFNGGNPNAGIAPGCTFRFQFTVTGSLAGLTEMSFLGLNSYDPPRKPDEYVQFFMGRFQRTGLDGEGSDVAIPQSEDETQDETDIVPSDLS